MNGNLAYKLEPREEIIGGKVVMMAQASTNHHRIADNIYGIFRDYLKDRKCEPFSDGESLVLVNKKEEYVPDGMVVCDPDKVQSDGVHGAPDLVLEVLSPSTARYDRTHKKDVYEKFGVREYWIVSPGDLSLEQYVLEDGKFVLRDIYHKYPAYMLEHMSDEERASVVTEFKCSLFDDLTIRLEDIFHRVIIG